MDAGLVQHPGERDLAQAVVARDHQPARTLDAFQFDAAPGYRAFALRVFHPGGKLAIALDASGKTGFPEMRAEASEDESSAIKQLKVDDLGGAKPKGADDLLDREAAELLDGAPDVASLKPFDLRVLCDRVEIEQRRAPAAAVVAVAPFVLDAYTLNILVRALFFAMLALTVDILWGYTGYLTFGQSAFFGRERCNDFSIGIELTFTTDASADSSEKSLGGRS